MLTIKYHGIDIESQDFPEDLCGYVAFSIAFAWNTHCRDKNAAIELLLYEANGIIQKVMLESRVVSLCRELDKEMDGVTCPAAAAGLLNSIRDTLSDLDTPDE